MVCGRGHNQQPAAEEEEAKLRHRSQFPIWQTTIHCIGGEDQQITNPWMEIIQFSTCMMIDHVTTNHGFVHANQAFDNKSKRHLQKVKG